MDGREKQEYYIQFSSLFVNLHFMKEYPSSYSLYCDWTVVPLFLGISRDSHINKIVEGKRANGVGVRVVMSLLGANNLPKITYLEYS